MDSGYRYGSRDFLVYQVLRVQSLVTF